MVNQAAIVGKHLKGSAMGSIPGLKEAMATAARLKGKGKDMICSELTGKDKGKFKDELMGELGRKNEHNKVNEQISDGMRKMMQEALNYKSDLIKLVDLKVHAVEKQGKHLFFKLYTPDIHSQFGTTLCISLWSHQDYVAIYLIQRLHRLS